MREIKQALSFVVLIGDPGRFWIAFHFCAWRIPLRSSCARKPCSGKAQRLGFPTV
jgi:hypothetical protein